MGRKSNESGKETSRSRSPTVREGHDKKKHERRRSRSKSRDRSKDRKRRSRSRSKRSHRRRSRSRGRRSSSRSRLNSGSVHRRSRSRSRGRHDKYVPDEDMIVRPGIIDPLALMGGKKKKSRWATSAEGERLIIPGMPTMLPNGLSQEQEKLYLLQLQIEETSRKLRTGDLGIPANPDERSPSPEPIYNSDGKRLNTREYRTRKKLEDKRHEDVLMMQSLNAEYKPPPDYKPPLVRVNDKVDIPQDEHPDINFVGLLIGPRGNTLKNLEKETGAKIIIRGKGSVKEGKIGRKDGQPMPGEDEPLHAYVTANDPENVAVAVKKIREIIKQGIEVPEGQNDLRRQQLRELALLNGTLRENDGLQKLRMIAESQTIITNQILCSRCGGAGHIAQDCKSARPGEAYNTPSNPPQTAEDKAKMDSEYMSLMAELGEGPIPAERKSFQPAPPPHFGGQSPAWRNNGPHIPNSSIPNNIGMSPRAICAAPPPTANMPMQHGIGQPVNSLMAPRNMGPPNNPQPPGNMGQQRHMPPQPHPTMGHRNMAPPPMPVGPPSHAPPPPPPPWQQNTGQPSSMNYSWSNAPPPNPPNSIPALMDGSSSMTWNNCPPNVNQYSQSSGHGQYNRPHSMSMGVPQQP